ncbi:hypothetical protein E2C01_058279 [Portunus trituberculatus]|uniref:Uncharacterized protein n=1 Tax=Portunus trituberculatus TaxID=210409 RepID=A0A5B7H4W6_PORTR|nr:hypothetical protein [Portunus trituberculatus]
MCLKKEKSHAPYALSSLGRNMHPGPCAAVTLFVPHVWKPSSPGLLGTATVQNAAVPSSPAPLQKPRKH